jgi:hypothetical protein
VSECGDAYDNMLNPGGFGVFSDEGIISGPYYTRAGAEAARVQDDPDGSSGLYIAGVCEEHEDQPAGSCERCNENEEDEDDVEES